jgi:hypothetical protein
MKNKGYVCDRCKKSYPDDKPAMELTFFPGSVNKDLCSDCVIKLQAWIDGKS